MTEVTLLSVSPSSSSAFSSSSSSSFSPNQPPHSHHKKTNLNIFKQDEEIDEMYNSLRRLSNSTAMSTMRLRKITPSPIPFKDVKKDLTFTLNEIYFTDGKPQPEQCQENENESKKDSSIQKTGIKKNLYTKLTKSIGTSPKNFMISDMISIDIDPESTWLPLMCKLMIIVEGAALERGTRVLVRDAGIQVGDSDNGHENHKEMSVPLIKVNKEEDEYLKQPAKRAASSGRELPVENKQNSKYRSNESINVEAANIKIQTISSSSSSSNHRSRNTTGSLTNLLTHHNPSEPKYSDEVFSNRNSGYFNNKNTSSSRCSKKRIHSSNQQMQSYLDLNEYNSAPYYQYQRKNPKKHDFSSYVIDELLVYNPPVHHEHESVEIHIPIHHIFTPSETHRNEKHIIINSSDTAFDTMRQNMRKYIDERLNKFEAEITFYNLADTNNTSNSSNSSCSSVLSCSPRHHHHHHHLHRHHHANVLTFRQTEPVSCAYHYHLINGCPAGCCSLTNHKNKSHFRQKFHQHNLENEDEENDKSVTNLMLMQIVNGRLIE